MARGRYLSFEEARKLGKLGQFAREHEIPIQEQHPRARERFESVLDAMCQGRPPKSSPEDEKT